MPIHEFEDNKEVILADLNKIGLLLNDNGVCLDISPIYSALNQCNSNSSEDFWYYNLESLKFNSEYFYAPGGTLPQSVRNIEIVLSVELKGRYFNRNNIQDPLIPISDKCPYSCDIEINAIDSQFNKLYSTWHFDKHFDRPDTEDDKFSHPHYHWTFGGNLMNETDIGHTIILPAPRIAHPPFDAILAIDYIIKHFMEKDNHLLISDDTEYIQIIQRAQCRLWRPYALSFSSYWFPIEGYLIAENFRAPKIFPELL